MTIFLLDDNQDNLNYKGDDIYTYLVSGSGLSIEELKYVYQKSTSNDILYLDFDGTITLDECGYLGSCSRPSICKNTAKKLFGGLNRSTLLNTIFHERCCVIITSNPATEDIDLLIQYLAGKHVSIVYADIGGKISYIKNKHGLC
jgi:hypothetical protein